MAYPDRANNLARVPMVPSNLKGPFTPPNNIERMPTILPGPKPIMGPKPITPIKPGRPGPYLPVEPSGPVKQLPSFEMASRQPRSI
jgi:hypothetical protein